MDDVKRDYLITVFENVISGCEFSELENELKEKLEILKRNGTIVFGELNINDNEITISIKENDMDDNSVAFHQKVG